MKRDSKLSSVLHVLLHMAERDGPSTSDYLAQAMQTNPVVVRRLMAGLRYAGFVTSAKGHGGGWLLSCPLEEITLGDIHAALGAPTLLAVGHRTESPGCVVEQAVNAALDGAYREAEAVLLARLDQVTLAALSKDFHGRMVSGGFSHKDMDHAV
ncbi:DNA-binding transcriptional regulator, IscR family [Rhodoferax sp. OV413]|jgi:DNA-binding IscR family transcriptional regulator|uniref:Rrf2 family transcriptional regulator n=1 Tax=Rhodoferax sp. OV413 TaxID=1855285 RepID=UPI0008834822|nr:Rrf2 family transcriptional regulator [Rhodoferax sp. OV413]SDP38826.1 DNA-binding transcriptional regulator, IscR family [Rhodoferax sp. OV413]